MKKLTFIPPSTFNVNSKKYFQEGNKIDQSQFLKAFEFAYEMSFGMGHHRNYRSGGQNSRPNGEKFCNVFQGKLAEIVLHEYFSKNNLNCSDLDFRIMGERLWDNTDLNVNDKHINIKSTAFFSNLFLLEQKDWNDGGQYVPNIETQNTNHFDYFVLVRLKPDVKSVIRKDNFFNSKEIEKNVLINILKGQNWQYDLPGFISHSDLVEDIIPRKHILPQNSLLNGLVKMDASNYYVQVGDMRSITQLLVLLHNSLNKPI